MLLVFNLNRKFISVSGKRAWQGEIRALLATLKKIGVNSKYIVVQSPNEFQLGFLFVVVLQNLHASLNYKCWIDSLHKLMCTYYLNFVLKQEN